MGALLEIRGVSKAFGAVRSLSDVSLRVEERSIVGLIGPNGAGKSTLINVLTGVYAPDSGTVTFAGRDLGGLSTADRARLGLVRTFQRPAPILDLSCLDGVAVGGLVRGLPIAEARRRALDILADLGLRDAAHEAPLKLPTGYLKLLDFARMLMIAPRLVLLDELMAGLSHREIETALTAIERRAEQGVSFLVVEHLLDVINRLSRRLVVLDAGVVVAEGEPATVIVGPRVIEAYLGDEADAAASAPQLAAEASSPGAPLLEVSGLTTGYEGVEVLHGVDLAVYAGETVCILGANGAGKSTVLRALMRQLPFWRGALRFDGKDMTKAKRFMLARAGIGYVPEGRGMLASLSVRENLEMGGYVETKREAVAGNFERVMGLFPALVSRMNEPAANLSGGQQQMLAIARALMSAPRLLLLDEPSLGLAPQIVAQVYATLTELKRSGQAILLVEQIVGKALALSDRAYVLDKGKIVLDGPSAKIASEPLLRNAYLGL
jgi:branched-chain amino acid transport system ATP-binding protein